jgi:hypothetical protein
MQKRATLQLEFEALLLHNRRFGYVLPHSEWQGEDKTFQIMGQD